MYENQMVEFKREYNIKVIRTMLAFLNTDGGTIFIGYNDDGTLYGLEGNLDILSRNITNTFRGSVTPDPTAFFQVDILVESGKQYIKIKVKPGTSIPYCFSKHGLNPEGVYIRSGSNTFMATREHIKQLIKDNGMGHFTLELSITQELTFDYARSVFKANETSFTESNMQTMGLVLPDGRYTNLALILSDQCPYSTKVAIFEGGDKKVFKDRKEFSGSIFRQIDEVTSYLGVFNKIASTIGSVYRTDHYDYPPIALREAFINSLVHRDYYIEGSTLVSLFDDRIEFMSLGGTMPGVTHDLMIMGVSVPRNDKLAQILYRLKIIEAYGTGIPRIFSFYEHNEKQPSLPIVDGGFVIVLPNQNQRQAKPQQHLSGRERQILDYFTEQSFSKEDAAELLGLSDSGSYKLLTRMLQKGELDTLKEGKKIYYTRKDKS